MQYRVIFLLKTTEYIPAEMVFGGAVISAMWIWTGYLLGDPYMIVRRGGLCSKDLTL